MRAVIAQMHCFFRSVIVGMCVISFHFSENVRVCEEQPTNVLSVYMRHVAVSGRRLHV